MLFRNLFIIARPVSFDTVQTVFFYDKKTVKYLELRHKLTTTSNALLLLLQTIENQYDRLNRSLRSSTTPFLCCLHKLSDATSSSFPLSGKVRDLTSVRRRRIDRRGKLIRSCV